MVAFRRELRRGSSRCDRQDTFDLRDWLLWKFWKWGTCTTSMHEPAQVATSTELDEAMQDMALRMQWIAT